MISFMLRSLQHSVQPHQPWLIRQTLRLIKRTEIALDCPGLLVNMTRGLRAEAEAHTHTHRAKDMMLSPTGPTILVRASLL